MSMKVNKNVKQSVSKSSVFSTLGGVEDFDPTESNVIKLFSSIIYEFFNELVFDRLGLKSLPRTNTLA
jgi:hypothetical protein